MRILLINPNISESVSELIGAEARRAASPGTEIEVVTAPLGVAYIETRFEALIGAWAAANLAAEHASRHDAIVVAAFGDPGLAGIREAIDVPVVYEDEHLLVVDKPAGLVVHPGAGRSHGTLVHALHGRIAGGDDPERPGIVHRLDRDTSGLMAVARTQETYERLQAMVRARELERVYLALVRGRPRSRRGTIDAPNGRDRFEPTRQSLDSDTPREAVTHFEVERLWDDEALLRVRLETGRMHQIRVHLAAIGLPVVGDPTYGVADDRLERQFLHAARLAFAHPITGDRLELEAPLPEPLQAFMLALG
jgi:23S rRNA pseudouridine1911/1915/1917 synthase